VIAITSSIHQSGSLTHQFANAIFHSTRRSAPGIEIWCRQNYNLLLQSHNGNIYRYHRDGSCFFVKMVYISLGYWGMEVIRNRTFEHVVLNLFAGGLLYNRVFDGDMPLIETGTTSFSN
jgi:hypothetical protein